MKSILFAKAGTIGSVLTGSNNMALSCKVTSQFGIYDMPLYTNTIVDRMTALKAELPICYDH